jgi:cytoskeletal protein RodZ
MSEQYYENESLQPDEPATPGEYLQRAREVKQWSQLEVAKQLNLNTSLIQCIEKNAYPADSSLTYIRGYLRSYARLVGISAEKVIAAFDLLDMSHLSNPMSSLGARLPVVLTRTKKTMTFKLNKRSILFWIVLALILGASVTLLWWEAQKKAFLLHPKQHHVAPVSVEVTNNPYKEPSKDQYKELNNDIRPLDGRMPQPLKMPSENIPVQSENKGL